MGRGHPILNLLELLFIELGFILECTTLSLQFLQLIHVLGFLLKVLHLHFLFLAKVIFLDELQLAFDSLDPVFEEPFFLVFLIVDLFYPLLVVYHLFSPYFNFIK
mmetsp:Transcript_6029/g.5435  ORF Transcript_6029/g.5435 Transcript_6029/m.5435 type:complete len:105 (-) Transcript_6029:2306-2620(-)